MRPDSASGSVGLAPFMASDGPETEDAIRWMIAEMLARRAGRTVEIVLTRQDAWNLLGIDLGTFREDQIPGLTLIDDVSQTENYLRTPAARRRLLINYSEPCALFDRQSDELAAVNLTPDAESQVTILADGDGTVFAVEHPELQRPSGLTRSEVFAQLMAMPTFSKL